MEVISKAQFPKVILVLNMLYKDDYVKQSLVHMLFVGPVCKLYLLCHHSSMKMVWLKETLASFLMLINGCWDIWPVTAKIHLFRHSLIPEKNKMTISKHISICSSWPVCQETLNYSELPTQFPIIKWHISSTIWNQTYRKSEWVTSALSHSSNSIKRNSLISNKYWGNDIFEFPRKCNDKNVGWFACCCFKVKLN